MILSRMRITKALIRSFWCTGWSAPLLFANTEDMIDNCFLALRPILGIFDGGNYEPAHEIFVPFSYAQEPPNWTPMQTYPAGLKVLILVCVFISIHTLCMPAAKAQASPFKCPDLDLPEPLLLDHAKSTKILCAGSCEVQWSYDKGFYLLIIKDKSPESRGWNGL